MIHPTAIVHPSARLGKEVDVGPYCLVGEHVSLGARARLLAHVVVNGHTTLGEDVEIHPFCTIGAPSQDRKAAAGEESQTTIGDRTVVREYATVHRGTADAGAITSIGTDCLLLAYTHVAHNCRVGNHVTMSNAAQLAGHVVVDDYATVGALAGVHQFSRIGRYAFVGGYTKLERDLPPFFLADGVPAKVKGLNLVGLRRAGFARGTIRELKNAYDTIYGATLTTSQAIVQLRGTVRTDEGQALLAFLEAESNRGLTK